MEHSKVYVYFELPEFDPEMFRLVLFHDESEEVQAFVLLPKPNQRNNQL